MPSAIFAACCTPGEPHIPMSPTATIVAVCPVGGLTGGGVGGVPGGGVGGFPGGGVFGGPSGGAAGGDVLPGGADPNEPLVTVGAVGVCGDSVQAAAIASTTDAAAMAVRVLRTDRAAEPSMVGGTAANHNGAFRHSLRLRCPNRCNQGSIFTCTSFRNFTATPSRVAGL